MLKLKSYAKVNLSLDILGKDLKTGFHFIKTVICEVPNMYDEIEISKSQKLEIVTNNEELNRNPKENLIYKAVQLLAPDAKVKISIKKNIPLRSGLGGGSSDAAAVLKGLNKVLKLKKTKKDLILLAEKLGTDVPFFIVGGICYAHHYGEKITPIKTSLKFDIKITLGGLKKSTKQAYDTLDLSKCGHDRSKTQALIQALRADDIEGVRKNIHNDFGEKLTGSGPAKFRLPKSQSYRFIP